MERTIERNFRLSPEEVQEAIWRFLKEQHHIQVPQSPSDMTIISGPHPLAVEVSWKEHAILSTDTLR